MPTEVIVAVEEMSLGYQPSLKDLDDGLSEDEDEDEAFFNENEEDVSLEAADQNQVDTDELQDIGAVEYMPFNPGIHEGRADLELMQEQPRQVEEEGINEGVAGVVQHDIQEANDVPEDNEIDLTG